MSAEAHVDPRPDSPAGPANLLAPGAGSPTRPRRSWRRKLLFALIAWLVFAGVLEGGIRILEKIRFGTFARAGQELYQKSDSGQTELKPNTDIVGTDMQVHVNSLKFRGREVTEPKPAGTVRVVCIGGSTTFDILAKSDDATWPARLEQKLRAKHPEVEVVNAGVAGYTIDSYLDAGMWKRIASLSPDVVIGYFATNEISAEARNRLDSHWLHCPAGDFEQPKAVAPELAKCPHCGAALELRDRSTPSALESAAKTITDWSLFAYKVRLFVDLFRKPPEIEGGQELPAGAAVSFEEKLHELTRRTRALGARPVLATFALRWRADQPVEQQRALAEGAFSIFVGLSLEGINRAFEGYNAAIVRVAGSESAVLIPAANALSGDRALFGEHDFVHFSAAGSDRMAAEMARGLESAGIPGRR